METTNPDGRYKQRIARGVRPMSVEFDAPTKAAITERAKYEHRTQAAVIRDAVHVYLALASMRPWV